MSAMEATLYRAFDHSGVLLYVGITENYPSRLKTHLSGSAWAAYVTRWEAHAMPDRATADAYETLAIETEDPVFNRGKRSEGRTIRWLLAYPNQQHADDITDAQVIQYKVENSVEASRTLDDDRERRYKEKQNVKSHGLHSGQQPERVEAFLLGRYERDRDAPYMPGKALWSAYLDWAEDERMTMKEMGSRKGFFKVLESLGYRKATVHGVAAFKGLRKVTTTVAASEPVLTTTPSEGPSLNDI